MTPLSLLQDFRHPTTLHQLAIFLRDAMSRRYNTHKAMVLVGPPDADDHCYVVALRGKEATGVMQVCGGGGVDDGMLRVPWPLPLAQAGQVSSPGHTELTLEQYSPPTSTLLLTIFFLSPKCFAQNNPFARPFEEVVESLGLKPSRSTFDSSLYYIRR